MISINPSTDKALIINACKQCTNFKKAYSEAMYLYIAEDNKKPIASALFEIHSNEVCVLEYFGDDTLQIFDGILRAGLSYADKNGIELGVIPENFRFKHRALFDKLNYPPPASFNIVNFFSKYKNCNTSI